MVSAAQPAPAWHDQAVIRAEPGVESKAGGFHPFGDDGFSFLDLIDTVNPLQHIPVIGTLYRELTGDAIDPLPRIAGSTLFFGPVGAGLAVANVVLEEASGKDAGAHVLAMLHNSETTQTAGAAGAAGTAGADGDDPVTAWLRAETAYRAQQTTPPANTTSPAAPVTAGVAAPNDVPSDTPSDTPSDVPNDAPGRPADDSPVLAWARAEAAYRAAMTPPTITPPAMATLVEVAAAPSRSAKPLSSYAGVASPGAVAPTGGWFSEVMTARPRS